jgi:hypothetical protein
VEALVVAIRDDVGELRAETIRTRDRLHHLETTTAMFVQAQKENRRKEEEQYRNLGFRIQWAGIALAAAAVIVPIALVLLTGRA